MENKGRKRINQEKIAAQDEMLGVIRSRAAESLGSSFCVTGLDVLKLAEVFDVDVPTKGKKLLEEGFVGRHDAGGFVDISMNGLRKFTKNSVVFADAVARRSQG